MAVTSIWKVTKRLDQVINYTTNAKKTTDYVFEKETYKELHDLIEYSENDLKTEEQLYVSAINCIKETAFKEMIITKKHYNKTDGILAFHAIQSFAEGEVTAETAHKIGVELAEELWGDRFEVLVSTHLNTKHYHNHFVINSVSFKDGKRYYDNNNSYALLRKTSDLICEEYKLSVLKEKNTPRRHINYEKIYNGQVSNSNYYITTKEDINFAIAQAYSYKDFLNILTSMEYEIFFRADKISVRRYPYKRNIRIERAFGEEYSIENIKRRILETYSTRIPFPEAYSRKKKFYKGKRQKKNKIGGIYKLYLYYCYLLKIFPSKYPNKYLPPNIRNDIKKMDRISEEAKLLGRNKITTIEQLILYKNDLSNKISNLQACKEDCYYKLKRNSNVEKVKEELSKVSTEINYLKEELMFCKEIEKRIPTIKLKIEEVNKNNKEKINYERRKKEYDHFK